MFYLAIKAALSGIIVAIVSEVARRSPTLGALVLSLPLISILAILWLWQDSGDTARVANFAQSTFWYVLPTLPMFLVMPALLRGGYGFWTALAASCALTRRALSRHRVDIRKIRRRAVRVTSGLLLHCRAGVTLSCKIRMGYGA